MFVGAGGFGVCELLIAPVHSTVVAGVLLFVCGVFFTSYTANSNTAIQLASPDYIRGRVLGLYYYAWNGLAPLGALLVGWLCDRGGTELAFGVGGTSALLIAIAVPPLSSGRRRTTAAPPARRAGRGATRRIARLEGRRITQFRSRPSGHRGGAGMAQVAFERVSKIYPDGTRAVNDINLEIRDGEFMVLVGPSGCGKTTALRMVAGLEEISEGELKIGDRVVNHVPSRDRDIAMVFQSYALYPHLSVYENIAFGLRLKKMPKNEIDERVQRAASLLGLDGLPEAQAARALRRPAPARRDGPRDRARAGGVPDGRAALEPRREAARADARRDREAPERPRRDDDLRHARPGRGDDDGRPRRRDAQGRAAAGRRPADALRPARQPLRRRLHRQPGDEHARRDDLKSNGGLAARSATRRSRSARRRSQHRPG